jgi:hypothetical protein
MQIKLAENFRAVFYAPFYATHALGFHAREGIEVERVAHREEALSHAMRFARGLDRSRADRFVGMYVNDWTLDFGPRKIESILLDPGCRFPDRDPSDNRWPKLAPAPGQAPDAPAAGRGGRGGAGGGVCGG